MVAGDLNRYIKGGRFFAAVFDVKLEKSAEDPRVSDVTAFDAGLLQADLLSMVHKPGEARLAYGQLAQDNPGQPEVQEALGYMDWHAGNQESARQYFSRAFASGFRTRIRLRGDWPRFSSLPRWHNG